MSIDSVKLLGRQVDDATAKRFQSWQFRSIVGVMIGYAIFYIVRKNLSMAIPGMEADPDLGFTKTDLGIFLTLNGVVYGISKFVNGFIGDRVSVQSHLRHEFRCLAVWPDVGTQRMVSRNWLSSLC